MSDHNPIYHLKDSYFFEVPKAMWRQGWKNLDDVPAFLREGHSDVTDVRVFTEAMESVGRSSPLVSLRVTMAL